MSRTLRSLRPPQGPSALLSTRHHEALRVSLALFLLVPTGSVKPGAQPRSDQWPLHSSSQVQVPLLVSFRTVMSEKHINKSK